ncbi:hypothetical protein [Microbacterium sp.]|uniref:hypothetical protein n=1 Tax=Microbacterium sp. TaxID=51671 RepID=UPI003564EB5F
MLTSGLAKLRGIHAFDEGASLPEWFRRQFHSAEPLHRYSEAVRTVGGMLGVAFGVFLFVLFAWVISTDGTPLVFGVPAAVIPLAVFGVCAWSARAFAQWPSLAERRTARARSERVFAVGMIPMTSRYMVLRDAGVLFALGQDEEPAGIAWSRIEAAGVSSSQFGVGLTLSIDGDWYDVPIVLEVGGRAASAWSFAPVGAKAALMSAVEDALRGRVPLHVS